MTTPYDPLRRRRFAEQGSGIDLDALEAIHEAKRKIRDDIAKGKRKESSYKYRHSEKGIANRKWYRKNTHKGLQHRIDNLTRRQNKLAIAKMMVNQNYDTSDMFWSIKSLFPEMSMEDIVSEMSQKPSTLRGQESILEFLDSLGEIVGPGAEFYNYPGGTDI